MIANAAPAAYCMMEDVDCSVSGWGWVLLIGLIIVGAALCAWLERNR